MSETRSDTRLVLDFLGHIDVEMNLSDNTLASYRSDLKDFQKFLKGDERPGLTEVTAADIFDYLSHLRKKQLAVRTAARRLSALRQFYRFLVKEKRIKLDPTATLENTKLVRALPEVLSLEEVTRLIESAVGEEPLELRDRAILEVWYGCGLRISELAALKTGSVVMEMDLLRVRGKGDKERLVPFGRYAKAALQKYLRQGRPQLAGDRSYDILFVSRKGGRLSRMGLWELFVRYVKKAGITKRVTPHILRHSCATHMVEAGADIRTVMEFLGHADIATTQIYTHLDQKYLKEVHRRCHPREKTRARPIDAAPDSAQPRGGKGRRRR